MKAKMQAGDPLPDFNKHIAAVPYQDARQTSLKKAVSFLESRGFTTSETLEIKTSEANAGTKILMGCDYDRQEARDALLASLGKSN